MLLAITGRAGVAWGLAIGQSGESEDTAGARTRSQTGLGELCRRNWPGWRARKGKAPEAGTRLTSWRNQEADKTECGSWEGSCRAQILEGLVEPGKKFGFRWLGVLSSQPLLGALSR